MSCEIINHLHDISNKSYLELGVFDNSNFNQIKCHNRTSVDVNGNATFTGTTDEFFASAEGKRFDIIFIDANHNHDYVERDFNNSVSIANEWVLLHDMIPPSEKYTQKILCSDSFRVLYHLLKFTDNEVYPMDENFGLTLVRMPARTIELTSESINLTYTNFAKFISNERTYSRQEVITIMNGKV